MARALIRYVAHADPAGKQLRTAIREALAAGGFQKRGNALWEADDTSTLGITRAVEQLLRAIADSGFDALDHLWFYVDAE